MSTLTVRTMTIRGEPLWIDRLPRLGGVPREVRLTNPGEFGPGEYVIRVDYVTMTATIEPKGTE